MRHSLPGTVPKRRPGRTRRLGVVLAMFLWIPGPTQPCRGDGGSVPARIATERKLVLSARIANARRDERRARHRKSLIRQGKARLLVSFGLPEGNDQLRIPARNDGNRLHPVDP